MNNNSYTENDRELYFTFNGSSSSGGAKSRILLDSKGIVQGFSWVDSTSKWSLIWQEPRDQCRVFAFCGAFGSCDIASSPPCSCLTGFVPKSPQAWSLRDYSDGCVRKFPLGCETSEGDKKNDRFVEGYELPDKGGQLSVGGSSYSVGSAQQCESICSYSCSCTAYAYQANVCSIWSGELFNLLKLQNDRYSQPVYTRLAALENETLGSRSNLKRKLLIGFGAAVGSIAILVIVVALVSITRRNRRKRKAAKNYMAEIEKNKGKLSGDQEVAMKRLSKKSGQGLEEFMNELRLIAKLQHTYLVRLLGCCVERDEKILIYEYMPNRSLDKFLFGSSEKATLDWAVRVKIAEGVAQGLLYIHKYSRLKVIHRDLKASNVLLDAAMNPKISDFGMARIFGIDQAEANTNRIVGTYGYMSPEYAFYGQFSEKSDVFSYGVLLLEIVSGRRNTDFYDPEIPFSLVCWAWELWKEGKPEGLIDPAVKDTCVNHVEAVKFIHVGLLCVQEVPGDRPTMSSVAQMLSSSDSQSFPLPGEPAFNTRRAVAVVESGDQVRVNCSNNQLTMSLPIGR
ncbi:unnamed protein product [Linum tenue]|uniref:non-specific serine/threonine protein kinase n=1 Tax=Linum tenue TaxID=586396 RepID=A0AAV0R155_9ROSI|nr:unnamed protein product [Linum tenue]